MLNLNNKIVNELCESFKIEHHNSSPYILKMNGVVEATNNNINKIIHKMVRTYNDWHEMLPFVLHGYRTSVRTSTSETLFFYGIWQIGRTSSRSWDPLLRDLVETKLEEAEWVQTRFYQLNLIEEKHMTTLCHKQLYQQWLKKMFDKKVCPHKFKEGNLILKNILHIHKDSREKWAPNYEGIYVVKEAFSGGALIITTMDREELPLAVNSDAVTKILCLEKEDKKPAKLKT